MTEVSDQKVCNYFVCWLICKMFSLSLYFLSQMTETLEDASPPKRQCVESDYTIYIICQDAINNKPNTPNPQAESCYYDLLATTPVSQIPQLHRFITECII